MSHNPFHGVGNMFDGGNLYQMAGDVFTGMGQAIQGDSNFQNSFDNASIHATDFTQQIINDISGNTDLVEQIHEMSNQQYKPITMDENGNTVIDWNQSNPTYGWSNSSGQTFWVSPDGESISPSQQNGWQAVASAFVEQVIPAAIPLLVAGQVANLPPQQQQQLQQNYPQYFGANPNTMSMDWIKMLLPIVALVLIFKR